MAAVSATAILLLC